MEHDTNWNTAPCPGLHIVEGMRFLNETDDGKREMAELTSKQVLQKLNDGWELRNRGTGWWVCEPQLPYQRSASEPISETVYSQLEADGLIETEMLTTSAVARLKRSLST